MKRRLNKKIILILLFFSFAAVLADGGGILRWVKYDAETGIKKFSDGRAAPAEAVPGQYYEFSYGRIKMEKQWRSPLDITETYLPKNERRVEFSHERHFAAINDKNCKSCHEGDVSIGTVSYKSFASDPALEPHKEKSVGRFCSECHGGSKKIEGRSESVFTALGRTGDNNCSRCHVPADHKNDYTSAHGEKAEHSGSKKCAECHRGSLNSPDAERQQALAFKNAQLSLIRNPEDAVAFKALLPDNFCRYCHNSDNKAWRDGERRGYESYRESRRRENEDDD